MSPIEEAMRKHLICTAFAVLAILAWPGILAKVSHVQVDRQTCQTIVEGMHRSDVLRILGGRPGDYRTHPTDLEFTARHLAIFRRGANRKGFTLDYWIYDDVDLLLDFDAQGNLRLCSFRPLYATGAEPGENFLWRLAKRPQSWFEQTEIYPLAISPTRAMNLQKTSSDDRRPSVSSI
jgi:hypothetical protein